MIRRKVNIGANYFMPFSNRPGQVPYSTGNYNYYQNHYFHATTQPYGFLNMFNQPRNDYFVHYNTQYAPSFLAPRPMPYADGGAPQPTTGTINTPTTPSFLDIITQPTPPTMPYADGRVPPTPTNPPSTPSFLDIITQPRPTPPPVSTPAPSGPPQPGDPRYWGAMFSQWNSYMQSPQYQQRFQPAPGTPGAPQLGTPGTGIPGFFNPVVSPGRTGTPPPTPFMPPGTGSLPPPIGTPGNTGGNPWAGTGYEFLGQHAPTYPGGGTPTPGNGFSTAVINLPTTQAQAQQVYIANLQRLGIQQPPPAPGGPTPPGGTPPATVVSNVVNHPQHGRGYRQFDGSIYFPSVTLNGESIGQCTYNNGNFERDSAPLPGTMEAHHRNLTFRDNYTMVDPAGSVHLIMPGGQILDTGCTSNTTSGALTPITGRNPRILLGENVVVANLSAASTDANVQRLQALATFTRQMYSLGLRLMPNSNGSYTSLNPQQDGSTYFVQVVNQGNNIRYQLVRQPGPNQHGLTPSPGIYSQNDSGNWGWHQTGADVRANLQTGALAALLGDRRLRLEPTTNPNVFTCPNEPGSYILLSTGRVLFTGGGSARPQIIGLSSQTGTVTYTNDLTSLTPQELVEINNIPTSALSHRITSNATTGQLEAVERGGASDTAPTLQAIRYPQNQGGGAIVFLGAGANGQIRIYDTGNNPPNPTQPITWPKIGTITIGANGQITLTWENHTQASQLTADERTRIRNAAGLSADPAPFTPPAPPGGPGTVPQLPMPRPTTNTSGLNGTSILFNPANLVQARFATLLQN